MLSMLLSVLNAPVSSFARVVKAVADAKPADGAAAPVAEEKPAEEAKAEEIGRGLPASPGAATGRIYFEAKDAEAAVASGEKAILVREETSPEDLAGMVAAEGILTARGGRTSHAAVVARGMGKCCVAGCPGIEVNAEAKTLKAGGELLKEGDYISLNGTTGAVYKGQIKMIPPEFTGDFGTIMSEK